MKKRHNNTKSIVIAIGLALALPTLNIYAQDPGGPPPSEEGGPKDGPGKEHGHGFHVLPPHAKEMLKLTDDQQKQIAALEAEVKEKMEKILTPEQLEQLKKMHPPHPGGPGGGGPGEGGPGGGPGGKPPGTTSGTSSNQ